MFLANTRLLGGDRRKKKQKGEEEHREKETKVLVHIKTGEEEHKIGLITKVEGLLCQFIIEI